VRGYLERYLVRVLGCGRSRPFVARQNLEKNNEFPYAIYREISMPCKLTRKSFERCIGLGLELAPKIFRDE